MSLKVGDSGNPLPAGGMRAVGNATTKRDVKAAKNRLLIPTENADPNMPQGSLDGKQTEPKVNPQNHSDPGTRGKRATFTGQIKKESEIPGDTTPIDNNNPTDKPAPVPPADPSEKADPGQGTNLLKILRSTKNIIAARKHPSNGTVKIPPALADAAELAGAKIKKNLYNQPIGIEYRVRGMGKLKMRIDERGEITSSVTSLNPAANPREMTSIFLQELQKNIPQTDVNDITANLLGLEVNLTTGEMSFNGEPIANFPMPGQEVVSYTFDRQGNFNLNLEALKDPNSFDSRVQRGMSSLHGGSGSALNNVSDSYNKMLKNGQQFQLSPFTIRSACAEIDVTYDALADYRSEIKEHIREPDVLLTTYSKHLQEAKDRKTPEGQLVEQAIDATIRQYQILTGNNLGETNMAYAKEFLTALKLNEKEGYAVEDLEIEDINNAAILAGIAAAAIEINFADFSEKLDGEIPPIHNQACLGINDLKIYAGELANDLNKNLNEGNPNPVIRDIVQGFNQQGIEKQDENKFNAFKDSANSKYKEAGSLALLANSNFRTAYQKIFPQQQLRDPQNGQEMLLKATWLVDSNPAISKENAPYLIVGTLKDKPEFQDISLQDLKHLAETSIALKDAMAGPNSPNSLLQKLDFKDPANCQRLAEETGQPIVIRKFDNDGNCVGATLYQPIERETSKKMAPIELSYDKNTKQFMCEDDPNLKDVPEDILQRLSKERYNPVVQDIALKFDLRADKIKVFTLNPAPAGGVPPPAGGVPPPAGGVPPPAGGVPPPAGGVPPPAGGAPAPAGDAPAPAGDAPAPRDGGKDENPLAPGRLEDEENPMFDGLDDDDFDDDEDSSTEEVDNPADTGGGGEGAGVVPPELMRTRPDVPVEDLYD